MTIELYLVKNDAVWFRDIEAHNKYGPAVVRKNGTKRWYVNGKIHRLNGPAVEEISGENEYWINHIKYNSYLEYIVDLEYLSNNK